jgi:hypothetical protein
MAENQHRQIKGYRDLSADEIALMNGAKGLGAEIGKLCDQLDGITGIDKRWLAIARTDLQKGIMALVRAIARPDGF